MTVRHPKPINQTPAVLLHHASELIQDVIDDRWLSEKGAWEDRAIAYLKNYGAYTNCEFGDPSDV